MSCFYKDSLEGILGGKRHSSEINPIPISCVFKYGVLYGEGAGFEQSRLKNKIDVHNLHYS